MARITAARLKGQPRDVVERERIKWYLRAIRHLERFLTQRERRPVPHIYSLWLDMEDPPEARLRLREEHKRKEAEAFKIRVQNDLLYQREMILDECLSVTRIDANTKALFEKLAREILQDETAVEDVMKCVRKLIEKERAERDR